jgi:ribosomal protein S13
LKEAGIDIDKKSKDLNADEENAIRKLVEGYKVEGD